MKSMYRVNRIGNGLIFGSCCLRLPPIVSSYPSSRCYWRVGKAANEESKTGRRGWGRTIGRRRIIEEVEEWGR